MNRTYVVVLCSLIAVVLILGYVTWKINQSSTNAPTETTKAEQAFRSANNTTNTLETFSGESVSLEEYIGQVIVLQFWASWDPASARSLTNMSQIQNEYDRDDVVIVAVNRMEPRTTAKRFLDRINVTNLELLIDTEDYLYTTVSGRTMPETVFYNASGDITYHAQGVLKIHEIRDHIETALFVSD